MPQIVGEAGPAQVNAAGIATVGLGPGPVDVVERRAITPDPVSSCLPRSEQTDPDALLCAARRHHPLDEVTRVRVYRGQLCSRVEHSTGVMRAVPVGLLRRDDEAVVSVSVPARGTLLRDQLVPLKHPQQTVHDIQPCWRLSAVVRRCPDLMLDSVADALRTGRCQTRHYPSRGDSRNLAGASQNHTSQQKCSR